MKPVRRFLCSLLVVFGLAAQPAFADDGAVKIRDRKVLNGQTEVAVAAFNVAFIFESTDQIQKTGGLMGAFGGVTKAKSELVGVTPEIMQAVADAAYVDFMAKLAARNITTVPVDSLFADANILKAINGTGPREIRIELEKKSTGVATVVKPSALPGQITLQGDLNERQSLGSFGRGFSESGRQAAIRTYVKESGIPLVSVVYLIDFSDQKRPGAFSLNGLKVNANLSVAPKFSRITVIGSKGQSEIVLNQAVSVDGDFIEQADATGNTEKTAQAAANVGGGLAAAMGIGTPMIGKTRKYAFNAKPGNYEEGAAMAATRANDVMTDALVSLR